MRKFFNTKILWGILSVAVGISLAQATFSFFDGKEIKNNQASVAQLVAPEKKSQYYYVNKDTNGGPKVSAKAFLVGDLNTGEVVLSKNQDQKFPIASVSKLMTALVVKEIANPSENTQISKKALATHGTNGGLRLGEKIKILDLLYPLLLESSNDAAEALALHFGRDNFISIFNAA